MKRERKQVLLAQQGSSITRERESSSRLSEIFSNSPSIASGHNAVSSSIVGGDSTHSPSIASGDSIYSPSLAEGARGWVDSTSASQAKSATAKNKNATASNVNFASISKADSALSAKSAKDTHPQPSPQGRGLKKPNTHIATTMKKP